MALRSGKEVDNKVSKKEHDNKERLKTIESDREIEKENDSSSIKLSIFGFWCHEFICVGRN